MSEFADSILEGFIELYNLAGSDWIVDFTGATFRAVQAREDGSYDMINGGTDFKHDMNLCCVKTDFPGGAPRKQTIVHRAASPNVKFYVSEDGGTENDADPTFTLKLELKK